ncbi:tryptophan halogenase family protein [Sphingomonas morindae]|uniref:Tryptophan 7-halogenase n=1 Tax=Sphingomonas morindae TaxID=1541170 RepID=A0ABY4X6C2_9SPHN|nr:tryptophan halogenase family protein [Sphingomonas morindae]USI72426.1 tryptophan 7-halogenase [Sphingomonas morindae]
MREADPDRIRSILIVGGGTAGWMAATLLAGRLARQSVAITLVESAEIGTVGVGEATVPGIRDFFRDIGVTGEEVMRASQGTMKLGIEFVDWAKPGTRFFHPFGLYGMASRGVPFHHFWLKRRAEGDATPFSAYSLCTRMAEAGTVMLPPEAPANDLAVFDWAVHFDAGLYARFLAARARQALGVQHVDGMIEGVERAGDRVAAVRLRDGRRLEADLFIDCSGFRSLLLGEAMGVDYEEWGDLLPCDRAVAMPCAHGGPLSPFTRSTALAAGWQWRIPLQHRVGNGYVYASRHLSDDEAAAVLRGRLEGEALGEPRLIRFRTGHRRRFWQGNVVGLGLAAGFLEPLESTSITLIQTGIERLTQLFPNRHFDPALADEYNRIAALEYARIRDFLLLHYAANGRVGEPLWDAVRAAPLPDKLAHKLRLFRSRGALARYEWESFQDPSWLSMYAGFDLWPERHDPMADYFTADELDSAMARMRAAIDRAAALAVPHARFIAERCAAPAA